MIQKSIKEKIVESPSWRTVFSYLVPLISGILSGLLVKEISTTTGILWNRFYKAYSFYGIIALGIVIYQYNKAVYRHDKEVLRFLDDDYCIAYMRSKCLPEAAERFREMIRAGNGGEFRQAMDELREVLK